MTPGDNAYDYDYDLTGKRLRSAVNSDLSSVANFCTASRLNQRDTEAQRSTFVWDVWNLICYQISTNTSSIIPHLSSLYCLGLDLSGTLQCTHLRSSYGVQAGGVGGLLSQTEITSSGALERRIRGEGASSYFPLADANGDQKSAKPKPEAKGDRDFEAVRKHGARSFQLRSVNCYAVSFIDEAGNVQAHYTYDAFGNTVSSSGAKDDDFRFRFSSKYLDDETGLYYYGYRYYAPELGRWMSRDPIGERGGINLMIAFFNNAELWVDLLGLENKKRDPCKICIIYEREGQKHHIDDEHIGLRKWAADTGGDIVLVVPPNGGDKVTLRQLKEASVECGVIAIVGHGSRHPKKPFPKSLDDVTTKLNNVIGDGFTSIIIDDLFDPKSKNSIVLPEEPGSPPLVILSTCNNGYAPKKLPNGSTCEKIHPNWQDYDKLFWDTPTSAGKRKKRPPEDRPDGGNPREPGGNYTSDQIRDLKARLKEYMKENCCDKKE